MSALKENQRDYTNEESPILLAKSIELTEKETLYASHILQAREFLLDSK